MSLRSLVFLLPIALAACTTEPAAKDSGTTDADADTDADSDTDADADADTDADTDADPSFDDGTATCVETVCGGDPTGQWLLDGGCVDGEQAPTTDCDGGWTQVTLMTGGGGSISLNGDGTFSRSLAGFSLTVEGFVSADCMAFHEYADCDAAAAAVHSTCTAQDGGCHCELSITNTDDPQTGTWTSTDTDLLLTPEGKEEAESGGFCVSASDELWTFLAIPGLGGGAVRGTRSNGN